MKPAKFEYAQPQALDEAIKLVQNAGDEARYICGGQSLGPMLNLRVVRPSLVVDLSRISSLRDFEVASDKVTLGSAITHAQFEDGVAADATAGLLQHVARGIAYRPVRNRGTLGGSLAHADPGGDWMPVMMSLDAKICTNGPQGRRELSIFELSDAPLSTTLKHGEAIETVVLPRLSRRAKWAHKKFARKEGDFAQSLAVVVLDSERALANVVLSSGSETSTRLERVGRYVGNVQSISWPELELELASDLDTIASESHWPDYARKMHEAIVKSALRGALS